MNDYLTKDRLAGALFAAIILIVGLYLTRRLRLAIEGLTQIERQQRQLLTKLAYYSALLAVFAAALSQLGIDLKVVIGAAGVLTVAVGFAAQTSTSNLISGLFLIVERPFVVGDVIQVGETRGEVLSIDLVSTKIRTFTNLMVRIPNETLVKSSITNYSYFPVRRLDFNLNLAHESNLARVESVLREAAEAHPLCLVDPKPVFLFQGFGEFAMNIQFQVWTLSENMVKLQNDLYRDFKLAFDHHGIRIPYPTREVVSPAPRAPATFAAHTPSEPRA